jgi:2,5-diamino-6-(ribosylamino)-4(3H)-pyrimidinone 5'-phosphate reductase
MTRPRVICHMAVSVDGRIAASGWPAADAVRAHYQKVHESYHADGWICGRVTMEPFAKRLRRDAEVNREHLGEPRADFVAPGDHDSYAIAIDASGRLAWESNDIDGDHVVAVLSERVSNEYLTFLRAHGVSYVLAGAREVDLRLALEKVSTLFAVKTLMLEGGGRINGGFLAAGAIDELSILIAPVADGRIGTPALFDVDGKDAPTYQLALEGVERLADDMLWLRYRVDGAR